jgi:ribosomal protein S1
VSVGDVVNVKIIALDPAERKIGLSIKEHMRDIEEEDKRKYGMRPGGETVSIGEIVGEAVPPSFLEEGKSIEEKALEMFREASEPDQQPETAEPEDKPQDPSAERRESA